MKDLVPREAYDVDETGYWKRMPIVAGLFFSIAMGVFLIMHLVWQESDASARSELVIRGVVADLMGGLAFGLVFKFLFKRLNSSAIDKLYYGAPKFEAAPPMGQEYSYRLPCVWAKTSTSPVGGVLYLGKSGCVFVPHKGNLAKNRVATEIAPLHAIRLRMIYPEMSRFVAAVTRLLVSTRRPSLEITWPGGVMILRVPTPSETMYVMNARLAELNGPELGNT